MNSEINAEEYDKARGLSPQPLWTLEQAVTLVRSLHEKLAVAGFTIALGGSCLHKGFSDKDVDIIIHPLDTQDASIGDTDFNAARDVLTTVGLTFVRMAHTAEYSTRCVEIWNTQEGKRVDVFMMDA